MRSLRLGVALLALALIAAACSDDGEDGDAVPEDTVATTTTRAVTTTTAEPLVTTPTSAPPETTTTTEAPTAEIPETTTTPPPSGSVAPPPPPSNLSCIGGNADNELLVEFDALPDPSAISKIRTYLQVDGEPILTNSEFDVGQIDTARADGTRWAARVRRVPANIPVKLYVTSFNQLGQESGWYSVDGLYTAAGAPCGTADDVGLPPPTGTAGFDEEEGEPGA